METGRDIMVHGIPNVTDANAILREELDHHLDRFGPIKWLRLGSNRGFHNTNFGFLRYEDETVHQEAVDFLNQVGVPHTRIWFELNRKPTQVNHLLQEAPAGPRVQRQLEELERYERQIREQAQTQALQTRQQVETQAQSVDRLREEAQAYNQQITTLEAELAGSRQLVQDLLDRQPATQAPEPIRAWVPLAFRNTRHEQPRQEQPRQREHMPLSNLPQPPTERNHNFTQGSCPVCTHSFETVASVVTTECGHLFCEACVHRWVVENNLTCPECRTRLGHNYYIRLHSRE